MRSTVQVVDRVTLDDNEDERGKRGKVAGEKRDNETASMSDCCGWASGYGEEDHDDLWCVDYWRIRPEYHDLYLQIGGSEYLEAISFEDGVDYVESERYYASLGAQHQGGNMKRVPSPYDRRPCVRELNVTTKNTTNDGGNDESELLNSSVSRSKPRSCLRKPSSKLKRNVVDKTAVERRRGTGARRFSYTGTHKLEHVDEEDFFEFNGACCSMRAALERTPSARRFEEDEPPRVAFERYNQVATIYAVADYPDDVRAQLWMSREERAVGVQRAIVEEQQRDRETMLAMAPKKAGKKCNKQHHDDSKTIKKRGKLLGRKRNSVDDVIADCVVSLQTIDIE